MVEQHFCMMLSLCSICSCTFELHESMLCPSTSSAHITFAHDVQLLSLRVQSMECSELWQQQCLAVLTKFVPKQCGRGAQVEVKETCTCLYE